MYHPFSKIILEPKIVLEMLNTENKFRTNTGGLEPTIMKIISKIILEIIFIIVGRIPFLSPSRARIHFPPQTQESNSHLGRRLKLGI